MAEIHDEELLEDISLCDLPISLPKEEEEILNNSNETVEEEEFAFGPTITGDPVCAADDVFHGGLILPLRPSSASFAGLSSSRSSSSSSSRNRNQFQAHHPSPKPHFRAPAGRSKSATMERASSVKPKYNNSMWDFFRVGLVRAPPELELQELKVSILRTNSRANNNSYNNNKGGAKGRNDKHPDNSTVVVEKQKMVRTKFLSGAGCKCSAEAVDSEALISSIVNNKAKLESNCNNKKSYGRHDKYYRGDDHDGDGDREKQKKQFLKDQGRRKQAVSHHRTYEWLKELSHANLVMHV